MSNNLKIQNSYILNKISLNSPIKSYFNNNQIHTYQSLTLNDNNIEIIELCTKKLEQNPLNKRALLLRASIYLKLNKYIEAKNDLEPLITDENLASTSYYLLGIINKKMNNHKLALEYFTKSIELDKSNVNAYFFRGSVNNALGNYKEAISDYNEAIYKDSTEKNKTNIYKNISKILSKALNQEINNNNIKQARTNSCMNERKIESKYLIPENNHKQKIKNIVVHSISNNFNFFIKNLSDDKAINGNDPKILINEINGFLNEGDNIYKPSITDIYNDIDTNKNNNHIIRSLSENIIYNNKNKSNNITPNSSLILKSSNISTKAKTEQKQDITNNIYESYISKNSPNKEISSKDESKLFNDSNPLLRISIDKIDQKKENTPEDELYCIEGEIARSKNNYYEAINFFTKAIQLNPNSFKAFFNRAFTYDKIGFYNEAICDYTATINMKQNHSFCYYNRGITYNKMGNIQKSISDFSRAIELDQNKPEFYFNRACLYKTIKNYVKAIEDYSIVINFYPNLYNPLYNRGVCYEKIKKYELSINDFESCIKLSKNNINPYYHIAIIYKILKLYDSAIKYLKLLLEIHSNYSPAYHEIGVILTEKEDYKNAINYFNKCIELDNKKPIYYHNRGWAYRKINVEKAINDISIAILLDNKNPKFYYNRASIYKNENIFDKAIEDYSTIILKFDSNNHDAYVNRAFCFAKRKNYFDAINDYTKAIKFKNNDYNSLYERADLYMIVGENKLAIEDLNKIIENDPTNENAYIKRAKCFENIKNIRESCNDYEMVLQLTNNKE